MFVFDGSFDGLSWNLSYGSVSDQLGSSAFNKFD